MHNCQPHTLDKILSRPRIATYTRYFHTRTHDEVVGIYLWNGALAAHFSTLLGYFEIALRNNIHRSISAALSSRVSSSIHWYDTLTLDAENQAKVDKIRYTGRGPRRVAKRPAPSPDEVVSRVSFGFWPHSLTILGRLYGTVLPDIFPHHHLSNVIPSPGWADGRTRRASLAYLYELNSFRNRIAHHEPIWKFGYIKDTSVNPPVIIEHESHNLNDSLSRLRRILNHIDEAFKAIDQDYYMNILQSECRQRIEHLLTMNGFNRYKHYKNTPNLVFTPSQLTKNFSLAVKGNRPIRIKLGNKSGIFIPD